MVIQQSQMRIRLPPDVRGWVEESAERNYRSINAEIVFWLNEARNKVLDSRVTGAPAAGESLEA